MSITDADRIRGDGYSIVLANGETATLRYDMLALKRLEDAFGSIDAMQAELSKGAEGKVFGALGMVLTIGMGHKPEELEDVLPLLSPGEISNYANVMGEALAEAFPKAQGPGDKPGNLPPNPASPGPTSITPLRSDSGAAMQSSGA